MDQADKEQDFSDVPQGFPEDPQQTYDPHKTMRDPSALGPTVQLDDIAKSIRPTACQASFSDDADPTLSAQPRAAGVANYILRRLIGTGGFGEVWEAIQVSLGRVIAVKRVREELRLKTEFPLEGTDIEFCREALIAASLDHPNIVPVYDFAVDGQGRSLLAMKYARGVSWYSMIYRDRSMDFGEFLAKHLPILVDVAQAVAFAHSRGIIHRDIKPSQVMVGDFGEVLLMDWGLAIVFDPTKVDETYSPVISAGVIPTLTTASNPSGTACFMAPEQTLDNAAMIGPWTDVYLLGGTLYFLLTDFPPHDPLDARLAFHQARSGEVALPTKKAPYRELPPELVDICMKALAVRPTQRYHSVGEFIDALNDYLSGASRRRMAITLAQEAEQVFASAAGNYQAHIQALDLAERARNLYPEHPEATGLREAILESHARAALVNDDLVLARLQAGRLRDEQKREAILSSIEARNRESQTHHRQRQVFLASTIVTLLLLVLVFFIYSESQRRAHAEIEAASAELAKEKDHAENLMGLMLFDLREELQPLGRLDLLEKVARRSRDYFDEADITAGTSNDALHKRAIAYLNIGDVFRGRGALQEAFDAYRHMHEVALQLVERRPNDDRWHRLLADSHEMLATVHLNQGRYEDALRRYMDSHAVRSRLIESGRSGDENLASHGKNLLHIGAIHIRLGDLNKARTNYEEGVAILRRLAEESPDSGQRQNDIAAAYDQYANALLMQGRRDEALELFRSAHVIMKGLAERGADNAWWRRDLAISHTRIGSVLRQGGELAAALAEYEQALAIRSNLVQQDPTNALWKSQLADSHMDVGDVLRLLGRRKEALTQYQNAIELLAYLTAADTTDTRWRFSLATLRNRLGRLSLELGDPAMAESHFQQAEAVLLELVAKEPESLLWRRELLLSQDRLAELDDHAGRYQEALDTYEKVRAGRASLVASDPTNTQWRHDLAATENYIGVLNDTLGRKEEAKRHFEAAHSLLEALSAESPQNAEWRHDLALSHQNLGGMHAQLGDAEAAGNHFELALAGLRSLRENEPENLAWRESISVLRDVYGGFLIEQKKFERALEMFQRDLLWQKEKLATNADDPDVANRAAWDLVQIGRAHEGLGNPAEAAKAWHEASEIILPVVTAGNRLPEYIIDTAATALLLEGRVEEAAPLIAELRERQYQSPEFWELVKSRQAE